MKKKIILLTIIICTLLCGCQPKNPNAATATVTGSEPQGGVTDEYVSPADEEPPPYDIPMTDGTEASSIFAVPTTGAAATVTVTAGSRVTSPATKPHTTAVKPTSPAPKPTEQPQTASGKKIYGVWISCYDHPSAAGKTAEEYRAATDAMFKKISDFGLNTAFVHMVAFSDAFYKSDIYPYSSYIAGKEGASLSFDPFAVLLSSAKKYGVEVHGWINPFRVSHKNDPSLLSAKNPAKLILDSGNADGDVCILPNGIYYNPASPAVHARIISGVKEILGKYDIAGIHIDDYFYPSTDKSVDEKQYSAYTAKGGKLSLKDWRISSVNAFVSSLYSAVKAVDPSLTVSISPAAQRNKNKNTLYADCDLWLSTSGYADIIIPQIYFGFRHEKCDFNSMLAQWGGLKRHSGMRLLCGIAAYKCGKEDKYAGSGSKEWLESSDIMLRQAQSIAANKNYDGFVVYSYSDLSRKSCSEEMKRLREYIKNNGN